MNRNRKQMQSDAVDNANDSEVPNPDSLATEINRLHEVLQGHAKRTLEEAVKLGMLLLEAKQAVGHGNWYPWLESHIDFSVRTAQAYMKLAQNRDELDLEGESAVTADLTLAKALSKLQPARSRSSRASPQRTMRSLGDDRAPPSYDTILDDLEQSESLEQKVQRVIEAYVCLPEDGKEKFRGWFYGQEIDDFRPDEPDEQLIGWSINDTSGT